jgi:hypothetical protein
MPVKKHLRVGVYRLTWVKQPLMSLKDIVAAIQSLPNDESRASTLTDDPIRPREIITHDDHCLMDFNRIRQTDHIKTSDLKGNEGEVKFGDLKPSERTAVLLDPSSQVMFVHEHAWGIGHTTIAKYLKAAAKLDSIRSGIVLRKGGLERLHDKSLRSMKVRLAGIGNAKTLESIGDGDAAILLLLQAFRAPDATIKVSIDSEKESYLDNILETASALIGWNSLFGKRRPVKEILVTTDGDEGADAHVNLMKDRISHLEAIDLEAGKEPTDAQRYRAVVEAWKAHGDELRGMYPSIPPAAPPDD